MDNVVLSDHTNGFNETSASDDNSTEYDVSDEIKTSLIKYILQSYRLLISDQSETWDEFHTTSLNNFDKYAHLTPKELCNIFQSKVLPVIFKCNLTSTQQRLLELIEFHPFYKRVPEGYMLLPENQRHCFDQSLNDGAHLRIIRDMENVENLDSSQTLAVPDLFSIEKFGVNRSISQESAALLSAVLLNSFELSNCTLLEPNEMLIRLRNAKQNFDSRGELPFKHLNISVLLEKIAKMKDLKSAVSEIMANKYF